MGKWGIGKIGIHIFFIHFKYVYGVLRQGGVHYLLNEILSFLITFTGYILTFLLGHFVDTVIIIASSQNVNKVEFHYHKIAKKMLILRHGPPYALPC